MIKTRKIYIITVVLLFVVFVVVLASAVRRSELVSMCPNSLLDGLDGIGMTKCGSFGFQRL